MIYSSNVNEKHLIQASFGMVPNEAWMYKSLKRKLKQYYWRVLHNISQVEEDEV